MTLALFAAGAFTAERWAQRAAEAEGLREAHELSVTNAALFDSELQKFRLLPTVLAQYPDVVRLLGSAGGSPAAVNAQLELLAQRTGAAAIYVIEPRGRTLSASNWRTPASFVGQNYAFRPYFNDAIRRGNAEVFALGTVSGRPGLFIASRVGDAAAPAGVIVVKIEFDRIERAWAAQKGTSFVSDRHDIVIVSGRSDWRFHTLRPLPPAERAAIERARLFDASPLAPLPAALTADGARSGGVRYARAVTPLTLAGARLDALVPLQGALQAARARAAIAVLMLLAALAAVALWFVRQRERLALQRAAQRELEARVVERTAELRDANDALRQEAALRRRSEERFRQSREELAQANRLATMGQVSAGVAHEINQPVAAIRTFAENARAFLSSGAVDRAGGNLDQIVSLTQRIGRITGELRSFSRRRTLPTGPVDLAEGVASALLLVQYRATGTGTVIDNAIAADVPRVVGDRVRIEQVFVNLVQNALDAVAGVTEPVIAIRRVASADDTLTVEVADNGRGIPDDIRDRLFTPFTTGRDDGLGLGLAIARDILREFGGDLALHATGANGTRFHVTLRTV
ncbi:sensor histidine kinase [Parablastomonas sp. CN1-191]|uniref:sensor histidine kinase n=1 Tax=Parablastomonas sp. CN1-191 TaxID=3400908 RepID=UPI003BF77F5C